MRSIILHVLRFPLIFPVQENFFYNDVTWDWPPNSIHIYQPGNYHSIEKTGIGTEICFCLSGIGINRLPACVLMADDKLISLFSQLREIIKITIPMQKEWIEMLCTMICIEI